MTRFLLTAGLAMMLTACAGANVTYDKHPKVGAGLTVERVAGR